MSIRKRGYELEWVYGSVLEFDPLPEEGVEYIRGWRAIFLGWNTDAANDFAYIEISWFGAPVTSVDRAKGDPGKWLLVEV